MIIRRRLWALPAALLLAGAGGGSAVQAEIPPENPLAGYTGSAASSGLRVGYVPKGVLPIASPVDLGAPDTLATINSGPLTFARASVADPGDLLANPDALLALIDPDRKSVV